MPVSNVNVSEIKRYKGKTLRRVTDSLIKRLPSILPFTTRYKTSLGGDGSTSARKGKVGGGFLHVRDELCDIYLDLGIEVCYFIILFAGRLPFCHS